MTTPLPPPLPKTEEAVWTYLKGLIFLFPALVTWLFTRVFLLPRLQMNWERAGIANSRAQSLLAVSDFFANHFWVIVLVLSAALLLLEYRIASWRRYRGRVVAAAAMLLNAGVLVGVSVVATCALLAAPLIGHSK